MPEQQKAPAIPNISEQMTSEKRSNVITAVKAAMEREKEPNRAMTGTESWDAGKKGWEEHVGSLAPLATSMLESQLTDRRPPIWQIACLFNKVDPDKILWQVGKEDRQLVLKLLGETADEVWGDGEAAKLETEIYDGSGLFDSGRLKIDFFGIAAEAIEALRKEKLLPEKAEPANHRAAVSQQIEELRQALGLSQEEETEADLLVRVGGKVNELLSGQTINLILLTLIGESLKSGMKADEIRKGLENDFKEKFQGKATLPEVVKNILLALEEREKGGLKIERFEQAVEKLPLLERMAVELNVSGKFEQEIPVGNEGVHNDLFALLFPELAGFDLSAKLARTKEGKLKVYFNALQPNKKSGGKLQFIIAALPLSIANRELKSELYAQDLENLWKTRDRQVKEWLQENIGEKEFLRRLKDPQTAIAINLANFLGKQEVFLKDGSLKFAWDNKSNLLAVSAERDNRTDGAGS